MNIYDVIERTAADLYIRALKDIPQDVRAALKRGQKTEEAEKNETANQLMLTILNNIEVADREGMLVCQDTGLPIFQVHGRRQRASEDDGAQGRAGPRLRARHARVSAALEHGASAHAQAHGQQHRRRHSGRAR